MSFPTRALGVFAIAAGLVVCRSGFGETASEASATEPVPTADSETLSEPGYAPPQWKDKQSPRYPRRQWRQARDGWVQLNFRVDRAGKAYEIAVVASKGDTAFQRAAIDALRRSTFEPGAGGASRYTTEYDFETGRPHNVSSVQARQAGQVRLRPVPRMRYDLPQEHRSIPH